MNYLFIFYVIISTLVIVLGNTITIVTANFWLDGLPDDPTGAALALQFLSSVIYFVIFLLLQIVAIFKFGRVICYNAAFGPKLTFDGFKRRFIMLIIMSLTDLWSNLIFLLTAPHLAVFLQAILNSTIPFYALFLSLVFNPVERKKNFFHFSFALSLILMVIAIYVGASTQSNDNGGLSKGEYAAWIVMFNLSCLVFAAWCVAQQLYLEIKPSEIEKIKQQQQLMLLQQQTQEAAAEDEGTINKGGVSDVEDKNKTSQAERDSSINNNDEIPNVPQSSPSITDTSAEADGDGQQPQNQQIALSSSLVQNDVEKENKEYVNPVSISTEAALEKISMLVFGTFFQLILFFPTTCAAAIPWFGGKPTVNSAFASIFTSLNVAFKNKDGSNNSKEIFYGFLFSIGYFVSYLGCAVLNELSPTASSIAIQTAAPVSVLLLIIIPKLDVFGGTDRTAKSVIQQICALVLLVISITLYLLWELRYGMLKKIFNLKNFFRLKLSN